MTNSLAAVAGGGLTVRLWPDEDTAAVFSSETVTTHLVSALSGLIIQAATEGPITVESIAASLNGPDGCVLDAADTASDRRIISETIDALKNSGFLRSFE